MDKESSIGDSEEGEVFQLVIQNKGFLCEFYQKPVAQLFDPRCHRNYLHTDLLNIASLLGEFAVRLVFSR
jgi:hypothetical protein